MPNFVTRLWLNNNDFLRHFEAAEASLKGFSLTVSPEKCKKINFSIFSETSKMCEFLGIRSRNLVDDIFFRGSSR